MNRRIKSYKQFFDSLQINLNVDFFDVNESLGLMYDAIMSSIGAEERDILKVFNLPEDYNQKLDLDYLSDDIFFINSLASIGLKKTSLQNSEDYETYLAKPCRFMFIYRVESNEIEDPEFILIQSWNDSLRSWENLKLYKLNGDIKRFYDKLSSKIIEITFDDEKYIYNSTNKNEWILQNSDKSNDKFKKYLRKEDLEELLKQKNIKLRIV
jgi:hypothetical protein